MKLSFSILKRGWILVIPFLFSNLVSGQSIRFSEFYDNDSGLGGLLNVVESDNNGFIAHGINNKNGIRQSFTVKVDSAGNEINNLTVFDTNVAYESFGMIRLQNGQIVSSGSLCDLNVPSPSPCDYYFARLDETGDTLFTKVYERQDTCDAL